MQQWGADFVEAQLYGVNYDSNSGLYRINEQTGAYQLVGSTGANLTGFAYDTQNQVAYAVGYLNESTLYTVDLSNGKLTSIGTIGSGIIIIDIAVDNAGHLYGLDINNDVLLSIDPGTAASTQIGGLGLDINFAQDLAYDRDNGVLYGTLYDNYGAFHGLYSIDTLTGAATVEYSYGDSGERDVDGDGVPDAEDNAPHHYNPGQQDADGVGDVADVNPVTIGNLSGGSITASPNQMKLLVSRCLPEEFLLMLNSPEQIISMM